MTCVNPLQSHPTATIENATYKTKTNRSKKFHSVNGWQRLLHKKVKHISGIHSLYSGRQYEFDRLPVLSALKSDQRKKQHGVEKKLGFDKLRLTPFIYIEDTLPHQGTPSAILSLSTKSSLTYQNQRILYNQWAETYEWEMNTYNSTSVWAELVLMQVFQSTSHIPSPCHLRTSVCCLLLSKLVATFSPGVRKVLNILTTEIFNSLYSNYQVDLTKCFRETEQNAAKDRPCAVDAAKTVPSTIPSFISLVPYFLSGQKSSQSDIPVDLTKSASARDTESDRSSSCGHDLPDTSHAESKLLAEETLKNTLMAEENRELKSMLLGCYFKSWKKECIGKGENIVSVIKAAKNRGLLGKAFRQWRIGIKYEKQLQEGRVRKRLGLPTAVASVPDSEDSESQSSTEQATAEQLQNTIAEVLILPESDLSSSGCGDEVMMDWTDDHRQYIGYVGQIIEVENNQAKVQFKPPSKNVEPPVLWFHISSLEYVIKGSIPTEEADTAGDALHNVGSCTELKDSFLLKWLNVELQQIERQTGVNQTSVQSVDQLKGGLAVATLLMYLKDVGDVSVAASMETGDRCDFIIATVPRHFPCWVTRGMLLTGSTHMMNLFLLAFFGLWMSFFDERKESIIASIVGYGPNPIELLQAVDQLVHSKLLQESSLKSKYPSSAYTTLEEFKAALQIPAVSQGISDLDSELKKMFVSHTQPDSCMNVTQFCTHLSNLSIIPDVLLQEVAHIAFSYAQGPAEDLNFTEDDSTLDFLEYRDALCLLHFWVQPPESTSQSSKETELVSHLHVFLSGILHRLYLSNS